VKPATIPRNPVVPHGLGYESLRLEAIEAAQQASGNTWTDYNPHDPGVTILEQLCFGLADLGYRLGFDVADLLCGPDGAIDLRRQALYAPEQILPCAPVTSIDFRKRLYSDFHEIQDVHLEQPRPGVHRVLVRARESADLARRIAQALRRERPLGEDFEEVRIQGTSPCWLAGEIAWDGSRDPAQVYADIHFLCGLRIVGDIRFKRHDELLAQGRLLEDLLDGPLTPQGRLEDDDFRQTIRTPSVAELVKVVEGIPGVRKVRRMSLLAADGSSATDSENPTWHLEFPVSDGTCPILALVPGCMAPVEPFLQSARSHLRKLEAGHQALRGARDLSSQLPPRPSGIHRDIARYRSIQEDFPGVYGIGTHGVPDGAPPHVRAHAKQLKAFLYPFEQIMVDFLANVEDLPRRFSVAPQPPSSYPSRPPEETGIPRIGQILSSTDAQRPAALLSRIDAPMERRNRLLDTLLAQYGESFPEHVLRNFNPYHRDDPDAWVREAKEKLLRHLPELTSRRTDPRLWKLRGAILLGLSNLQSDRPLAADEEIGRLPTHDEYLRHPDTIPLGPEHRLLAIGESASDATAEDFRLPRISDRMFRAGCDARRYFLLERPTRTVLAFHEGGREPAFVLSPFPDTPAAIAAAEALRGRLRRLNRESEGFHLVEHVLLRPRAGSEPFAGIPADWFSLRISIVLPDWSARFADPDFQELAEETLFRTLPAHVHASFHWVDFPRLREFESLLGQWREAHRGSESGSADSLQRLDDRSSALARFLRTRESEHPSRTWH